MVEAYSDVAVEPAVRGFLHEPAAGTASGAALVLTHSAGGNCQAPLLVVVAEAFAASGVAVLRCDLPFRQARAKGPPLRTAALDQAGLRSAVESVRKALGAKRMFLGGHSYGGRQATMLAADEPDLVEGLLLLSYPLHPPRKPEQRRTQHFARLRTPALFVHGERDPFGTIEEMRAALALVAGRTELVAIEGAGHDLGLAVQADALRATRRELIREIVEAWRVFAR